MTVYVDMNQLAKNFPFSCSFDLSSLSELSPMLGKQVPRQIWL